MRAARRPAIVSGLFLALCSLASCGSSASGNGGGDAGPTGGSATFTQVYSSILSVSCVGSDCHAPGVQGYVSYANKDDAYHTLLHAYVMPGDSASSELYRLVSTGMMPLPPNPMLLPAKIALIESWIDAGALDD